MLYSKLFGKTVKTTPKDLSAISHKLLYQGGFIRQISAGRYAFLPLGYRVWAKLLKLIDEEMESLGSQRINTPTLQPLEFWQKTNRDVAFGNEMHILDDHHGATFVMSATGEGLMVELTKMFNLSYKDLPFYIHQFIGKFRDEKRASGGLLRVREFVMKDAYSFDVSEKALDETYQKFYNSYLRIAEKMGLKAVPVLADSGAIGGDYNHEFLIESESGQARALLCDKCGYAAEISRAESGFEPYEQDKEQKEVKEFWDKTVVNCELLAKKMGVSVLTTTKTIMFKTEKGFVAVMIRGDYDINEIKLKNFLNVQKLELASEEEILELTEAKVGFVGPVDLPKKIEIIADFTCKGRVNFEAGGNKTGLHLYNLNFDRDVPMPEFADIRNSKEGDSCQECKTGTLQLMKGIEWGHCFKLDQFYSKPHDGIFVSDDGTKEYFWMGSYGIGLGRSMATVVEKHFDSKGIIWPQSVAPFLVHLVGLNLENKKVHKKANEFYEKLKKAGVEVLFDDRIETSAGEKFADADLIGCPYRVVVSAKTKDKVEVKKRNEDNSDILSLAKLVSSLLKIQYS